MRRMGTRLLTSTVGSLLSLTLACNQASGGADAEASVPTSDDLPDTFLAIHFEPRSADVRGFEVLRALVQLADAHEVKLTLQFTPSWARMILADPDRVGTLREWQARGHEVAAHHHGARHGWEWDGYTNLPEAEWRVARERAYQAAPAATRQVQEFVVQQGLGERYLGDAGQAMDLLRQLAGPRAVRTMTMGPDRVSDWPADVPYSLDNIVVQPDGSYSIAGGAITRPAARTYSGHPVQELSMRFVSALDEEKLAEVEYTQALAGDVVGFVTHIEDFAADPRPVQAWLAFLGRGGPGRGHARTASSILAERSGQGDSGPRPPAYGLFQLYGDEYRQFRSAMGYSLPDYWSFVDRHVAQLDVHYTRTNVLLIWAMVEPALGGGYDWDNESKTDAVVRATYAPAAGKQMDMLLVFDPARGKEVPVEQQRSYPYGHEAEWQAFVRAAVERYDGDGVGDADPHVRVKHWQVMNEPFANLRSSLLSVQEYVKLVKLTAQAIREADPEARVVLGDTQLDVAQVVPLLAGGGWFDAVDTHFYPAGEDYVFPLVGGLRQLLDAHGYSHAQVWMGEMGVYLHAPRDPDSPGGHFPERGPADQARILVKALLANRAIGATRILVVNLVSWSSFGGDPRNLFNFMGLVSSGTDSGDAAADLGRERIAYHAYRRLIAATETDVAELVGPWAGTLAPLRVIEFRRRADGGAFFVAWSDGADAQLDLPWGVPQARVTNLVSDATGSFTEGTASAVSGRLSVTVGRDPLLIEPLAVVSR